MFNNRKTIARLTEQKEALEHLLRVQEQATEIARAERDAIARNLVDKNDEVARLTAELESNVRPRPHISVEKIN